MKRCLIAAGGTGGHFYPALALAHALNKRGWNPLLLMPTQSPARKILEGKSLPYLEIDLPGWRRNAGLQTVRLGLKLLKACLLANRILGDFRPDAVMGMGGSTTLPAMLCACARGLPRAVHESNANLGLANRLGLMLGAKLFRGLPGKDRRAGELMGTPIRKPIWSQVKPEEARLKLNLEPGLPTLLVFGGSLGAATLNTILPGCMARARLNKNEQFQVLHLTGRGHAEQVLATYIQAGIKAAVLDYLEAMELAYAAADLVICRSGAGTLAELAAQKKPAILVPYPFAAAAHQEENAGLVQDAGAAVMIKESELALCLPGLISELLVSQGSAQKLKAMSEGYARLGLPTPLETTERLADAVENLAS